MFVTTAKTPSLCSSPQMNTGTVSTRIGVLHAMYAQVEKWVRQSESDYVPPAKFAFEEEIFNDLDKNIYEGVYGTEIRHRYFSIDPSVESFLAHGSYGAVPKPVMEFYQRLQRHIELQPVRFFYDDLYPHVILSLRAVAKLTHCPCDRLVFVPNVEFGMSSVIRSMPWALGQKVLMFDLNYGAVKMSVEQLGGPLGVEVVTVPFPIGARTDDDIISALEHYFDEKGPEFVGSIKLAFFEHVTSPTAIRLPVKRLTQVCRARGIRTMIDGAHALGLFDLDLSDIDPDYYVSNGHKWLCNARGAAILYVKEEFRPQVHPLVISWGASQGFNAEFIWQGTMDYCAQISMRAAIRFLNHLGGLQKVTERNRRVAHWAGQMLASVWGTETLVSLEFCDAMVCIRVPESQGSEGETCAIEREPLAATAARKLAVLGLKHSADRWQCTLCHKLFAGDSFLQNHFVNKHSDVLAKDQRKMTICGVNQLQATLWQERRIEVPFFGFRGKQYIRISCHVYNCKEEFERLAEAVCEHLALPVESKAKIFSFSSTFPQMSSTSSEK